jgi:hypothetical protein
MDGRHEYAVDMIIQAQVKVVAADSECTGSASGGTASWGPRRRWRFGRRALAGARLAVVGVAVPFFVNLPDRVCFVVAVVPNPDVHARLFDLSNNLHYMCIVVIPRLGKVTPDCIV